MQVIDNYLPEHEFRQMQNNVLAYEFPWFYQQHVSLPPEDGGLITDPNAVETFGYSHTVYDAETNYSINKALQNKWQLFIAEELNRLKPYSH